MKVTDYDIVTASSESDLREAVKQQLGFGWQPQGGMTVAVYHDRDNGQVYYTYCQATVKYEGDK